MEGTGTSEREGAAAREIGSGKEDQWRFAVQVPADASLTRPYYSRPDEEQPFYNISDDRYLTSPLPPYPLAARARISYRGVAFDAAEYVQTSERVPGIGMLENPLMVGPAISVTTSPSAGAVPLGSKEFSFTATVHSNVKGAARGTLHLTLPAGWRCTPSEAPFSSRAMAKIRPLCSRLRRIRSSPSRTTLRLLPITTGIITTKVIA